MRNLNILTLLAALLCYVQGAAVAETWPTFEDYVTKCVLIVKAKTVVQADGRLSFQAVESWKGQFAPRYFVRTSPEGRFFSSNNEHGVVNPADGQEIVFFFTDADFYGSGKIGPHSTAFPVRDGKVVYGSTSWTGAQVYSLEEFKTKICALVDQEEKLLRMINELSVVQLYYLEAKVKKRLQDLKEAERKKWETLAPVPSQQPVAPQQPPAP